MPLTAMHTAYSYVLGIYVGSYVCTYVYSVGRHIRMIRPELEAARIREQQTL